MSERNGVDVNRLVLRPEAEANKEFLVKVIKLNNWFIAHQLSAYQRADQKTKDNLDKLYLEFNRRWEEIIKQNKTRC